MKIRAIAWMISIGWLMIIAILVIGHRAGAHEWYEPWCCSDQDCRPAQITHNPDGSITAVTDIGTATFPPGFQVRPSQDGRDHACLLPGHPTGRLTPRCLYLGAGM